MGKSLQLIIFLAFQVLFSIVNGSKPSEHGLTIKLVHRDSPGSPLYQPNLTETQRTRNLILQSISRSTLFSNTTLYFNTEAMRSRVGFRPNSVYMAQVGFGTFGPTSPPIPYFLHMDTGSTVTWTQCEGCRSTGRHCFHQSQPFFPDSRSRSHRKLPCNRHRLCFPNQCTQGYCTYHLTYGDNASTAGFLGSETLTFGSEAVPNLVFGCGLDQLNMNYDSAGYVAGILGLGWGQHSLVSQLGRRAQGRFSHCLQMATIGGNGTTLLRFGTDVPVRPGLRTTDLIQRGSLQPYFVNLADVSVAGRWLRILPDYFAWRPTSPTSGALVDSGTTFTLLVEPAYHEVERAVERHLASAVPGLTRILIPGLFRLCYQRPAGAREQFGDLPGLTFHFWGDVDMAVGPQGVFRYGGTRRPYFCLAMKPTEYDFIRGGTTILGAYQQTNQRFIYDVARRKLHFGPEDCSRDG